MKDWKKIIMSPYMIIAFLAIKVLTYYHLIGVNVFQNLMVLGSIVVFGTIFVSLSYSKSKWKKWCFLGTYTFFSIIMFADTMYYNYYNETVSIKQIWQVSNVAKVPSSFVATLIPASFLILLDIPFVYYYFKKVINHQEEGKREEKRKKIKGLSVLLYVSLFVLALNPIQSQMADKINSVEFFTNHISDIYSTLSSKVYAKEMPKEEILETISNNIEKTSQEKLKGIGKGKNLIVIQIEALQNFVIGAEYNGQEITPNLNRLLKKDTLYFDKFYSTIGKGNTADAEFTTLNSLYPVIDGESYRLYQENTYNGLPWLLKDQGYETFAVHGYEGGFWNRNDAYPYQGIDEYYSMEDLEQDEIIGLGISDQSMFRQTIEIMKKKQDPFFSFLITLTNHHPFLLDDDKKSIPLLPEHEGTKFGSYLETVYYTDQALGEFLDELKEAGLYENSILAMYGDHHGLNCKMDNNDVIVSEYLGRNYDYDEMLKVPMMIHIPESGVKETIETLGGQIDFLPTISNIMDLKIAQPYILGRDLVNAKKEDGFVAFTAYLFDGSFAADDVMFEISREGVFHGSRAWQIGTGEKKNASDYQNYYQKAYDLKEASTKILEQDLISEYVTRENILK